MGFFKKLTAAIFGLSTLAGVQGASLQQVTNFGANTSGTKMYTYVPDNLASNPAIIVAIHYCSGTAQAYYTGTPYARLAEQYGFIVIYPESPYSGTCWDVSSTAALTHNGGADSNSIANMVTYTLQHYNGDSSRVYVTGSSSGAMMTNVMAATYPEMFAAAIVYSGVPAGCFYTGTVNGWNSTCSQGQSIHTQQEWANTVFQMYPGYSGARPRMQIYHGSADSILLPPNFQETVKQWTGVFGYSTSPQQTLQGTPSSQYTKYIYGPNVEAIYGQGVGHTVPVMGDEDMKFFGIVGGGSGGGGGASTTRPPTTTSTQAPPQSSTPSSGGGQQSKWGQCGGIGWSGPTQCQSGLTCTYFNDWYSQCL